MKASTFLLLASLAANLAVGVVYLRNTSRQTSAPSSTEAAKSSAHQNDQAAAGESTATRSSRSTSAESSAAVDPKLWAQLSSGGDLAKLVAHLRAAGFPTSAIRGIISAQLRDRFAPRRKELFADIKDVPFWVNQRIVIDPKIVAAQRELQITQSQMLKELLGADGAEEDELSQYYRRRQFGELPADKGDQLRRISSDYSDLKAEIYSNANGMLMPEDREQIAYLEKEMRADLAKVLTPEELLNYELRSSTTAASLRAQLTTFQPTEAEFRALFAATRSAEEKLGTAPGIIGTEQYRQRQAAINEEAKKYLAPDRYAAFEQATDPRYAMVNRVVARYGLPTTVVPEVGAVQQDIQKRMAIARVTPNLSAEQRTAQLTALAQEASTKLAPLLGEKGFAAYKQFGGQWIQIGTQLPRMPRPPGL